jgi:hypothetical protein
MRESSEEIVWIESEDALQLDGMVIRPVGPLKSIAVVHVHGFTSRFSLTSHVLVGRELARHGFTSVSGNNRGYTFGKNAQRHGTSTIGGPVELDLIRRNAVSAASVDTHIVPGADHVYTDRTTEVADLISGWLDSRL